MIFNEHSMLCKSFYGLDFAVSANKSTSELELQAEVESNDSVGPVLQTYNVLEITVMSIESEGSEEVVSQVGSTSFAYLGYLLTRHRAKIHVIPNRRFAFANCLSYALVTFNI